MLDSETSYDDENISEVPIEEMELAIIIKRQIVALPHENTRVTN